MCFCGLWCSHNSWPLLLSNSSNMDLTYFFEEEALSPRNKSTLHQGHIQRSGKKTGSGDTRPAKNVDSTYVCVFSLFCSCHSFTPAPAVWWIIEECLSSLASLVNQSSDGCPPHFNKSFRPSGQVHQSRRSQGRAGNSSAIFSHNIQNTIPTSAPTNFQPVLPRFIPSSPPRLLSSLPFLPRRIPVWDDVTLTRPQWTLQHRVTKGMF